VEQGEAGQPPARRLVGIDLGIASRHSVRVLEADGRVVCRSSCVPTVESLAGLAELTQMITAASHHQQGHDRARQWRDAAAAAAELYDGHPAVPFAELAAEVATEIQLQRGIQAELAAHTAAREQHYLQADPARLARSLPGFAEISAPVLIAAMGRPGRFRDGTKFKSYVGLAPRASETGETDRKGQSMSKAGPSLLRATFFRAADTARRQDPQLARIYYLQMTERGATHLKACSSSPGTSPNGPGPSFTTAPPT
jgi:Transposase IS116/IS110/IS902 family